MSKKSLELIARENAIKEISKELEKVFDSFDVETVDKLKEAYHIEELYKYSKPHQQILEQALKFHEEHKYSKALELFLELASHGSDVGAEYASLYYWEGKGTPKSQKKAYEMYVIGAKSGSIYCRYREGFCLFFGKGTSVNRKNGLLKLEEAAFLGVEEAIWTLIDIYSKGTYVKKDDDVVDFWTKKVEYEIGIA